MSSLRQTTPVSIMRPPKPPSWRDFIATDAHNKPQSSPATTSFDIAAAACRVYESRSTSLLHDFVDTPKADASPSPATTKIARIGRRPRAKIHRTRSEHVILSDELPLNDLGLGHLSKETHASVAADLCRRKQMTQTCVEACTSPTDIARRCQSWLASIEACEPLDEVVSYTSGNCGISSSSAATVAHSAEESGEEKRLCQFSDDSDTFSVPFHSLGEDVDVEIPEEMFVWSEQRRMSSPFSREDIVSPLTIETIGLKSGTSAKLTQYSIHRSGSQLDAFIPKQKQESPYRSEKHVEFVQISTDNEDSYREDTDKDSTKLCCDMCMTFTCYRRKDIQSDT